MRLKRLYLRNCFQHEELDWTFGDGLIAILGSNGSGKSNALNAAFASLSGNFMRHSERKAGHIRRLAKKDDPAFIRTTAEHGGTEFTITRQLRSSKHELICGDKVYTKDADISDFLDSTMKLTSDLLGAYVFVAQWHMFDFIGTESKRAEHFTQLCRTEKAERLHEMLRRQLDLDRAIASQVVDNSDSLRGQIASYRKQIDGLLEQIQSCQEYVLPQELVLAYEERLSQFARKQDLRLNIVRYKEKESILFAQAKAAVGAWRDMQQTCQELAAAVAELRVRANAANLAMAAYEQDTKNWRRKCLLEKSLAELAIPDKPQPIDLETCEYYETAWHAANNRLRECRTAIEKWETRKECPECGTPVEKLNFDFVKLRDEISDLEDELKGHRLLRGKRKAFDERMRAWETAKLLYDSNHAQLLAQLEEVKDVKQPNAPELTVPAEFAETEERYRQLAEQLELLSQQKEQAKANHKANADMIEKLTAEIDSIKVTAASRTEAEVKLNKHQTHKAKINNLTTRMSTLNQVCEDIKRQLSALETQLARTVLARRWVNDLSTARDFLHRNKLPAAVHQRALEDLIDRLNEVLAQFGNPFYATASKDLSITAHFPDGTDCAAQDLSGGQKMVLALAYRLSVNSLFASQVGLLVLDEPTACVDDEYVEQMIDVFAGLGRAARASGQQIIVVTHEERLKPVFDQVITVAA